MQLYLETINAYAAAINGMNAEAFAACFAEDSELYDPANASPFRGRDGAIAFFSQFEPLLKSIHIAAGEIHFAGNQAAFTWRLEATSKTGSSASAEGIDAIVFNENGKIVTVRAYWDAGALVAALTAA